MMKRLVRALFLPLVLIPYGPIGVAAQGGGEAPDANRRTVSLGLWTGVSWRAAGPSGVQRVGDRELFLVAFRYRRVLLSSGRLSMAYTGDLVPLAVATDNSSEVGPFRFPGVYRGVTTAGGRFGYAKVLSNTAIGVGAAPAGVELTASLTRGFAVAVGGTAGFIMFSRAVPFANTRKLNVTADIGAGFQISIAESWKGIGGYKYHHISNAGMADFNPGLNSRVWYLGTMLRR